MTDLVGETALYCTGRACQDCAPDNECCEAVCGCCPRVDAHDLCWLHPGALDDTVSCDQHEMYDILRHP